MYESVHICVFTAGDSPGCLRLLLFVSQTDRAEIAAPAQPPDPRD